MFAEFLLIAEFLVFISLNFQCSLSVLHEGLPSMQERVLPTGPGVERILLRPIRLLRSVLAESCLVLRRLLAHYTEGLHQKGV